MNNEYSTALKLALIIETAIIFTVFVISSIINEMRLTIWALLIFLIADILALLFVLFLEFISRRL